MGDGFENEENRSRSFDNQMDNYLPVVRDHGAFGEASKVYRRDGRCLIIRQDKVEMESSGDAYTQVARAFDLACERMEENGIVPDSPVFLLCIMGLDFSHRRIPHVNEQQRPDVDYRWWI